MSEVTPILDDTIKKLIETCGEEVIHDVVNIDFVESNEIISESSYLGGYPFVPKDPTIAQAFVDWYRSVNATGCYPLIIQILCSDLPKGMGYPEDGMIQLFESNEITLDLLLDADDSDDEDAHAWHVKSEDYATGVRVIYYPQSIVDAGSSSNPFDKVETEADEFDSPLAQDYPVKAVFEVRKQIPLSKHSSEFAKNQEDEKYVELVDDFFDSYNRWDEMESLIGIGKSQLGELNFLQGGVDVPESHDFQLQVAYNDYIDFGDCGALYFSCNSKELVKNDVTKFIGFWDCG